MKALTEITAYTDYVEKLEALFLGDASIRRRNVFPFRRCGFSQTILQPFHGSQGSKPQPVLRCQLVVRHESVQLISRVDMIFQQFDKAVCVSHVQPSSAAFSDSFRNRSTSCLSGIDGAAPGLVTLIADAAVASFMRSTSGFCSMSAATK